MSLAVSHDGSHCLIEATGSLDLTNVSDLDQAIGQAGQAGFGDMVVVDLARLTFLDTAALGMLVAKHYALRAAGGRLVIMHPPQKLQRLILVNRLDEVLDIRGTTG